MATTKTPLQTTELAKLWLTADGDVSMILTAKPGTLDFDLTLENEEEDEIIQVASTVDQLDEMIKMLTTAKEVYLKYASGEKIENDVFPSDEDDNDEGEDEEDDEEDDDANSSEDEDFACNECGYECSLDECPFEDTCPKCSHNNSEDENDE